MKREFWKIDILLKLPGVNFQKYNNGILENLNDDFWRRIPHRVATNLLKHHSVNLPELKERFKHSLFFKKSWNTWKC